MVVKSHRQLRHEREHNELADWLAERIDALKPYSTQIAIAAVAIAVAVAGGVYYFSTADQATAKDWSEYRTALNDREPEKALQNLYNAKPASEVGLWAAQTLGDIELSRGAALMFSDRDQAKDLLEKAEAHYKLVESGAQGAVNDLDLLARARLGLGKVYEALCKPEDALKYYQLVADSEKESALGKAAAKAADRMQDPRDVALLAWFAQQTPKKAAPLTGPGGGVPGLPDDLPERPDISPPSGLGLDNIGTGIPDSPGPSLPLPDTSEPKPGATKPDAATPEDTKPDETKPEAPKPEAPPPAESKTSDPDSADKPD